MQGGAWIDADEACRRLGAGTRRLIRLVDAGLVRAKGVDGRMLLHRDDVDREAMLRRAPAAPQGNARRSSDPAASASDQPFPQPSRDELEQALLLGRFIEAAVAGRAGPCPVCGEVMLPSKWPKHLIDQHR